MHLIYLNCHPTGFSGEMVNNPVLGKPPAFLYCHAGVENLNRKCLAFPMKYECHILKLGVFNVNSSFSLENGSEEKVLQGSGFLPDQCLQSMIFPFTKKVVRAFEHLN